MKTLTISPDDEGVRIDRIVRKTLVKSSLSEIYRFIRKGVIRVNGKRIKQNYRVKAGDNLEMRIHERDVVSEKEYDTERAASLIHTDFFRNSFNIIYEDETLLVCNKPAGIVVHGGTGHVKHDTLIDCAISYIMQKSRKGTYVEPVLVHRLDRDTSGVILIAKNKQTLRVLHQRLRDHTVEKKYIALCHGTPQRKKGNVDLSLVRTHERNRGMKMKVHEGGVHSLSRYRVLSVHGTLSQIEIDLHTGRTHQIRVHMAHIGCPVIGDVRYGDKERDTTLFRHSDIPNRLYLHAEQVSFHHPVLDRNVSFTASLPNAFQKVLNSF